MSPGSVFMPAPGGAKGLQGVHGDPSLRDRWAASRRPTLPFLGQRRRSLKLNRHPQNRNLIAMLTRIGLSFQLSRQDHRGRDDL